MQIAPNDALISQIMALKNATLEELKAKYTEIFGQEIPCSGNKVFLWRRIAHRLQEVAYGELSDKAHGRIKTLIAQYDPVNNKALRPANAPANTEGKRKKQSRDMRLPIPGTVITKEYKAQTIEVRVLEKGFEYKGKVYKSLTAIAKEITNAHWNGFLFFNL
jgi:hypothetical protein